MQNIADATFFQPLCFRCLKTFKCLQTNETTKRLHKRQATGLLAFPLYLNATSQDTTALTGSLHHAADKTLKNR